MRRSAAAVLMLLAVPAFAQAQNTVNVPPPPPIVSAPVSPPPVIPSIPPTPPPPGLVQPTIPSGSASTAPATPPQVPDVPDVPPPAETTWLPGQTATIGVLNKVDGSTATLAVPVGGTATAGDLQVSVQSCLTRPPGQLPDAAIFLTLQPTADSSTPPVFRGWIIESMPGATVAGNAGESFRVVNCS